MCSKKGPVLTGLFFRFRNPLLVPRSRPLRSGRRYRAGTCLAALFFSVSFSSGVAATEPAPELAISGAVGNPGTYENISLRSFSGDILKVAGDATPNAYPFMWVLHETRSTQPLCDTAQEALLALIRQGLPTATAPLAPPGKPLQLTVLRTDTLHAQQDRLPDAKILAIHVPGRQEHIWLHGLPRGKFAAHRWAAPETHTLLQKLQQASQSLVLQPDGRLLPLQSHGLHAGMVAPGTIVLRIDTPQEAQNCLSGTSK